MDRLIYTALSGMQASMNRQRVLASNLANAQTVGFHSELIDQRPVTIDGAGLEARALLEASVRGARMSAGPVVRTDQPLDIAIDGEALLAVQNADGEEAYTRRGDLARSASGLLVNGEGRVVLGRSGPISIPEGHSAHISPDGTISTIDPAAPDAPPIPIDRIKLVSWSGSSIKKDLDGLFRVEGGGILPVDEPATVTAGALEQSNVKSTEVLVEMIDAQRLFAMRTKLIATARECDEGSAQLMRLS